MAQRLDFSALPKKCEAYLKDEKNSPQVFFSDIKSLYEQDPHKFYLALRQTYNALLQAEVKALEAKEFQTQRKIIEAQFAKFLETYPPPAVVAAKNAVTVDLTTPRKLNQPESEKTTVGMAGFADDFVQTVTSTFVKLPTQAMERKLNLTPEQICNGAYTRYTFKQGMLDGFVIAISDGRLQHEADVSGALAEMGAKEVAQPKYSTPDKMNIPHLVKTVSKLNAESKARATLTLARAYKQADGALLVGFNVGNNMLLGLDTATNTVRVIAPARRTLDGLSEGFPALLPKTDLSAKDNHFPFEVTIGPSVAVIALTHGMFDGLPLRVLRQTATYQEICVDEAKMNALLKDCPLHAPLEVYRQALQKVVVEKAAQNFATIEAAHKRLGQLKLQKIELHERITKLAEQIASFPPTTEFKDFEISSFKNSLAFVEKWTKEFLEKFEETRLKITQHPEYKKHKQVCDRMIDSLLNSPYQASISQENIPSQLHAFFAHLHLHTSHYKIMVHTHIENNLKRDKDYEKYSSIVNQEHPDLFAHDHSITLAADAFAALTKRLQPQKTALLEQQAALKLQLEAHDGAIEKLEKTPKATGDDATLTMVRVPASEFQPSLKLLKDLIATHLKTKYQQGMFSVSNKSSRAVSANRLFGLTGINGFEDLMNILHVEAEASKGSTIGGAIQQCMNHRILFHWKTYHAKPHPLSAHAIELLKLVKTIETSSQYKKMFTPQNNPKDKPSELQIYLDQLGKLAYTLILNPREVNLNQFNAQYGMNMSICFLSLQPEWNKKFVAIQAGIEKDLKPSKQFKAA